MVRKIIPLQSVSAAAGATVFIPAGTRIHHVTGECSTKPTYDFVILTDSFANSAAQTMDVKYCGVRNGAPVNLWKEFPLLTNRNVAAANTGENSLRVIPGTGVSCQVYFAQGLVDAA